MLLNKSSTEENGQHHPPSCQKISFIVRLRLQCSFKVPRHHFVHVNFCHSSLQMTQTPQRKFADSISHHITNWDYKRRPL